MALPSSFVPFAQVALVCCLAAARWQRSEAWIMPPTSRLLLALPVDTTGARRHQAHPTTSRRCAECRRKTAFRLHSAVASDEYEYVEYDILKEEDFAGSEWLLGTNWDSNPQEIAETWVRLAVDGEGQNVAIWGDNSQGKWSLDVASQFLAVSKEGWLGKQIWACTTDDYYYLQGTVRGWTYLKPASVLGQWQAKRLGVEPEEAGPAPWFEDASSNEEEAAANEDR